MATGHSGFAILNRAINPLVRVLIRSPLHWLVSRRLALITYTGRRSSRRYTIPVGYQMADLQVTITRPGSRDARRATEAGAGRQRSGAVGGAQKRR